jgi:hypothetical protein
MRRLLICGAVAFFSAVGASYCFAASASWRLLAAGMGTGTKALAGASVPGIQGVRPNHSALRVMVTTSPALPVDVAWDMYCANGHTASRATQVGNFSRTFARAPGCALAVTADLGPNTGTVRIAIYGR